MAAFSSRGHDGNLRHTPFLLTGRARVEENVANWRLLGEQGSGALEGGGGGLWHVRYGKQGVVCGAWMLES